MKVYAVVVRSNEGFLEGPIHVSAHSYTEVEEKLRNSTRYSTQKVASITLLGALDNLG